MAIVDGKKFQMDEGGYFEDIAIIKYLYDTINEVYEKDMTKKQLFKVLSLVKENTFKGQLVTTYDDLIKLIKQKIKEFWPKKIAKFSCENLQYLEPQYRRSPLQK